MQNILIAESNTDYAIKLMNYINDGNKSIRICYIAKNQEETIKILNNNSNIDIVLLDCETPFYNGKEIMEEIKDKTKYNKSFILLTNKDKKSRQLNDYQLIYTMFDKENINITDIVNKINELVNHKELRKNKNFYEKIITDELLYLGYDISLSGTQYLIETIKYIALSKKTKVNKLEKDIYPIISKVYNTSVHNIKCRINSATILMYYNCEEEKLKAYFNFNIDEKPKVKTVINTILNKIL